MNRWQLDCAGTSHMHTRLCVDWLWVCDRQPAIGGVRGQHLLGFADEHPHAKQRVVSVHRTFWTDSRILITLKHYNLHTQQMALPRTKTSWVVPGASKTRDSFIFKSCCLTLAEKAAISFETSGTTHQDMAPHPRRPQSSTAPLRELQKGWGAEWWDCPARQSRSGNKMGR
jgi:hypothetical protein